MLYLCHMKNATRTTTAPYIRETLTGKLVAVATDYHCKSKTFYVASLAVEIPSATAKNGKRVITVYLLGFGNRRASFDGLQTVTIDVMVKNAGKIPAYVRQAPALPAAQVAPDWAAGLAEPEPAHEVPAETPPFWGDAPRTEHSAVYVAPPAADPMWVGRTLGNYSTTTQK